jgi:hypothetical protein
LRVDASGRPRGQPARLMNMKLKSVFKIVKGCRQVKKKARRACRGNSKKKFIPFFWYY